MQCQWEITVPGPHPGCAEFAPPETITCPDEATTVVRFEPGPYPDDDGLAYFCGHHATTEAGVEDSVAIADLPMICTACGEPVWAKYPDGHAIVAAADCPQCAGLAERRAAAGIDIETATEHARCSCPELAAYIAAMQDVTS